MSRIQPAFRAHSLGAPFSAALLACLVLSACQTSRKSTGTESDDCAYVPSLVTGDIKDGIEQHISEQVEENGGYFKVPFEFRYQATLPAIQKAARCWLPLAGSDDFQKVDVTALTLPGKSQTLTDSRHGNRVLFLELGPEDSGKPIEIVYDVERLETGAYVGDASEAARHLQPDLRTYKFSGLSLVGDRGADADSQDIVPVPTLPRGKRRRTHGCHAVRTLREPSGRPWRRITR